MYDTCTLSYLDSSHPANQMHGCTLDLECYDLNIGLSVNFTKHILWLNEIIRKKSYCLDTP